MQRPTSRGLALLCSTVLLSLGCIAPTSPSDDPPVVEVGSAKGDDTSTAGAGPRGADADPLVRIGFTAEIPMRCPPGATLAKPFEVIFANADAALCEEAAGALDGCAEGDLIVLAPLFRMQPQNSFTVELLELDAEGDVFVPEGESEPFQHRMVVYEEQGGMGPQVLEAPREGCDSVTAFRWLSISPDRLEVEALDPCEDGQRFSAVLDRQPDVARSYSLHFAPPSSRLAEELGLPRGGVAQGRFQARFTCPQGDGAQP